MEKMYSSSLTFVLLCLIGISLIEAAFGFSVELIHRDSPKSPFYLPTETHFERVANAIRRSINHASHFKKSFSTKNVESNVVPDRGEYLMSYSIGTPPFKVLGILDTGSDIIWLQCKPCDPCYNQTTPIFDPSKSKTYRNFFCTSHRCHSVRATSCPTSNSHDNKQQQNCQYTIVYGDGSESLGDLSLDTLTLRTTKGSPVQFPKTVIGCGHSNTGLFQGRGSGIVGLGNGPVSFITQLGSLIQGKFSYCLTPSFTRTPSNSTLLNFGDDAVVSGHNVVSTPLFPDTIFYNLTLIGFSVGNKRVDFGSSSFSGSGKSNIIIDSGTTLTLLPLDLYSRFELAVAAAVKLERTDDPSQILSLCYKAPLGEKVNLPIVTAHFSGADVRLNALNTFIQVSDDVTCLAFAPNEQLAIFGNLAQQNLLIGYDLIFKRTFSPSSPLIAPSIINISTCLLLIVYYCTQK